MNRLKLSPRTGHFLSITPRLCQRAYRWSFWNGVKKKIELNSPKNMWCGLFHDVVIGPCFFNQPIIKQENVLNTLLQFALPHPRVLFQLDGERPQRSLCVKKIFRTRVSWSVDRTGPLRSTDVPFNFIFLVMWRAEVWSRDLLTVLNKHRIWAPIYMVTNDMLTNTHRESLMSRLQLLYDNGGSHIDVFSNVCFFCFQWTRFF